MDAIAKTDPAARPAEAAPRARPTLGAWLALAFSAMSVLLTVLLAAVIERAATAEIGTGIEARLAELARQTAGRMDRGVFERYREIELLARRLDARRDPAALQLELTSVAGSYRYYGWIGVTDAQGIVRAASHGLLVGTNVADRPWFRAAQVGRHLGDVREAVPLDKLLNRPGAEPLRFFDVAFPLEGGGVLAAHVSWEWAKDVRAAIFGDGSAAGDVEPLVLARDGTVLLGPAGLQGRRLELGSVKAALVGAPSGSTVETWPDGRRYVVGYARSRGHERSPGLGWTVLVRQEHADAFAPVRAMQGRVLVSGIAIAVLFSVLGWLVARAITAPLAELAASARGLQAGNAAGLRPSTAYREVAQLGEGLSSLVQGLQRNQAALQELNAQLEQRVAERTAEMRSALERVQASEQRIRTIVEAAQDPFVGMDLAGRIIEWNGQAEKVFGWRREEVIGRPVSEVLHPRQPGGELEGALQAFLDTGQPLERSLERVLVDRHGREITVEVKVGFVDTGRDRFFSAFVHDITARKEIERLKEEFVSTVSHELRTPLTSIYGSLSLLNAGTAGELPADAAELVRVSHDSTERLVRLINDMLDVEKIASGKIEYRRERQPLRPLLEQAVRDTQAFAEQLRVAYRIAPGPDAEVACDADRLVQVCVNLLSNAAKFSPWGEVVDVSLAVSDGAVRVSVVDRGPGIPPEFRARVFDRFAQADASDRRLRGGTGLGLNICRSIVEAHGGRIGFDSEPGVRTEFWFELPAAGGTAYSS